MNRRNGNGFFIIFIIILIIRWVRHRKQASMFNKPQLPSNLPTSSNPAQLPTITNETKTENN